MARYLSLDPQKHERMLSCAILLFAEQGVEQVGIADITKAAGLAKGTFYLYFKNREAVVQEAFARCFALNLRHSMQQVQEQPTYCEKLKQRVLNILCFIRNNPVESALLRQFYQPVNVVGSKDLPHSPSYDITRELIQGGITAGEFRPLPMELLCQLFFSGVEGIATYMCNNPAAMGDSGLVNQAVERLIQLLR